MNPYKKQRIRGKSADVLIEPAVKKIEWANFLKYRDFIREGEKAVVCPKLKRIKDHIRRLEKQGKHTFVFTKLFGDGEYNINSVREGKAVHNPEYAEELIEAAKRNMDQIEPMLGKKK